MAFCPSCGTENNADARFCRNCGKAMDVVSASAAEPDPVTGMPTPATAASGSSGAGLVIGVVLALVAVAAAGGYYFLSGPGSSQGAKTEVIPPPPPVTQPASPPVGQQPAQAQIAEPPTAPPMAPPADVVPPPPMQAPPSPDWAPPQTPQPAPPKPRRKAPTESAFFPEGNPPMGDMPPPGVMVEPNGGRWMRMRDDMYRCGYETYCQEKVRQRYCAGYWGRVPDCVRTPGYAPY